MCHSSFKYLTITNIVSFRHHLIYIYTIYRLRRKKYYAPKLSSFDIRIYIYAKNSNFRSRTAQPSVCVSLLLIDSLHNKKALSVTAQWRRSAAVTMLLIFKHQRLTTCRLLYTDADKVKEREREQADIWIGSFLLKNPWLIYLDHLNFFFQVIRIVYTIFVSYIIRLTSISILF